MNVLLNVTNNVPERYALIRRSALSYEGRVLNKFRKKNKTLRP